MRIEEIKETNTDKKPVIVNSVNRWLPITMTWLYNLLVYQNEFKPIVIATEEINNTPFVWNPLYISSRNKFRHFLFKVLKKTKIKLVPFLYDTVIKEYKPCIIHSHFGNRGWYDLPIVRKYRLKHIVTFYGFDVNMLPMQDPVYKRRYKELFDGVNLVLCEGQHMAKCIINQGCPEQKIRVQQIGVEIDKISFVPRKIENNGLIKILIASTFREKKGIPYALEAVGILKEKYPNIRVTVIGDATEDKRDQKEKLKITDIIRRYKLYSIVKLLGFVPQHVLWKEAYKHHIFLSPSVTAVDGDTEGGAPISLIEMSASGMPIVSTWHCDIPEVVKDGVTGRLVKERDINGLAGAIEDMVNKPEKWIEYGFSGRRRMETFYNVKNTVKRLEGIYKEIL